MSECETNVLRLKHLLLTQVLLIFGCMINSVHMNVSTCNSAKGTTQSGYFLDGYTFRTLEAIGLLQCAKECFVRPGCLSFNYITNRTCQLNYDTASVNPSDLKQQSEYKYSEISTWSGFQGNCARNTCSIGQKCVDVSSSTKCVYTECMGSLDILTDFTADITNKYVGSSFQVSCKTGYKKQSSETYITCMTTGNWELTSIECHRAFGDWIIVARFGSANSYSTHDTWLETGRDDNTDTSMPEECTDINTSNICTRHFRSGLIDEWSTVGITEVKFALYTGGNEVVYIVFDATNTNWTSWFSQSKLMTTSYTDLTTNVVTNYFTISGYAASRRFYINMSFGGCDNDHGWIQIVDALGSCSYDSAATYPKFMYSPNDIVGHVGYDSVTAEVLAIFLKIPSFS